MDSRSPAPQALLVLLASTALSGATCAARPEPIDVEPLGLGSLDVHERASLQAAAAALACPCQGGHTLAECQAADHPCPRSGRLLRAAGSLARMGARPEEILGELVAYEQSRLEEAPLTLAPAACKGPEQAPVTIVVFSDFECPACANLPLSLDALLESSGGKARLCFKNFPLSSHPNAHPAAQAAELAIAAGHFWELHDRLFANQFDLEREGLRRQARAVGLDDEELSRALDSQTYHAAVQASLEEGAAAGVAGTPTLFFNGRRLPLPPLPEFLELALEDALEAPSLKE